jgi:hypothetical protein
MNRCTFTIVLAAALLPGLAGAEDKTTVYRTVNADGTVTYSQVETRDAQATTVDGRAPASAPAPAAAPAAAAAAAAAEERTPEQQACANATANLALIDSGQKLLHKDAEGNDVMMTDADKAAARAAAQRQATAFCEPAGS